VVLEDENESKKMVKEERRRNTWQMIGRMKNNTTPGDDGQ